MISIIHCYSVEYLKFKDRSFHIIYEVYFTTLLGEIRHNFSTQNIYNMNIDERIIIMNNYKILNYDINSFKSTGKVLFLAQIFNFFALIQQKNKNEIMIKHN